MTAFTSGSFSMQRILMWLGTGLPKTSARAALGSFSNHSRNSRSTVARLITSAIAPSREFGFAFNMSFAIDRSGISTHAKATHVPTASRGITSMNTMSYEIITLTFAERGRVAGLNARDRAPRAVRMVATREKCPEWAFWTASCPSRSHDFSGRTPVPGEIHRFCGITRHTHAAVWQ
jgi:hypothetical protein